MASRPILDSSNGEEHTRQGSLAGSARYEIRVRNHIDLAWSEYFAGMSITHEGSDVTVISGVIADQAALQGLLARVGALGLALLSVRLLDA